MIRRWLAPVLLGLVVGLTIYQAALKATPRFLMAAAERRIAERSPRNRMTHAPLADHRARAVVRPSPDLAYSSCPFDLMAGPLAIVVPPVPAPYWSLSVFDARTDVAFVRNDRDARGGPIRVVVARRGQAVPPGVPVARVDGSRGVALVRILVEDRQRFAALDQARRAATCRTLPA